jgi:hypothetical protein
MAVTLTQCRVVSGGPEMARTAAPWVDAAEEAGALANRLKWSACVRAAAERRAAGPSLCHDT